MPLSAALAAVAWTSQSLYACRLSDLLAALPLALALFSFASSQINAGCIFFVASVWLSIFLEGLSRRHRSQGYGHIEATESVRAPTHISRSELRVAGDGFFRDGDQRRVIFRGVNVILSDTALHADDLRGILRSENWARDTDDWRGPHSASNSARDAENWRYNSRDGNQRNGINSIPSNTATHAAAFSLQDAPRHFARMQACGWTLARLAVTWDAVEHSGPGQYDEAYLAYLRNLVRIGAEHNMSFVVSVYQDAWSRGAGGCGAPDWTMDKVGFNVGDNGALRASGAVCASRSAANYQRLACGTMFTLFFGGRDFCPGFRVAGVNIQDYLQGHFLDAMARVAEVLRGEPNVLGFNSLRNPSMGMLGCRNLAGPPACLRDGDSPTWFQSFQLGAGLAVEAATYGPASIRSGSTVLNASHQRAWRTGVGCLWKQYGVWGVVNDQVELLQPDYFCWRKLCGGARVGIDPVKDYFAPFAAEFQRRVHGVDPRYVVLVTKPMAPETVRVAGFPLGTDLDSPLVKNLKLAWAPPWFDLATVATRAFRPWIGWARDRAPWTLPVVVGLKKVQREYARQLGLLVQEAATVEPGLPVLIGETGCPMDLACDADERDDRRIDACDVTLAAADEALVSACLWHYLGGDAERSGGDYAMFAREKYGGGQDKSGNSPYQQESSMHRHPSVFAGGRALPAIVRPYAFRVPGLPLSMRFCVRSRVFAFSFRHDPTVTAPMVVFVPRYQYPRQQGLQVEVSGGRYEVDWAQQALFYWPGGNKEVHSVCVRPACEGGGKESNDSSGLS